MMTKTNTPGNCEPVHGLIEGTFRFKHYKSNSQQAKKGILGRWQSFNGYGWNNCEEPECWREYYKMKAAPDMYEALEQAMQSMLDSGYRIDSVAVRACDIALAKARGES